MTPANISIPASTLLPEADIKALLATDKVALRVQEKNLFPNAGQKVGVRLNLNIMKTTGKAIQTIHDGGESEGYKKNKGFYTGEAIGYAQAVRLKNAFFNVHQQGRESIAIGETFKHPMASVDGEFVSVDVPSDFEGIELRFNPKQQHLFVDTNNHAVQFAEDVIVLGNRVYAKNVVYYTEDNAPKKAGTHPSETQFRPAQWMSPRSFARPTHEAPNAESVLSAPSVG